MRRQFSYTNGLRGLLYDVPDRLFRDAFSPCLPNLVDPAKQSSSINCGRGEPIVQFISHPIRKRNRSNVAAFTNQIDNSPVFFALLKVIQG